MHSMGCERKGPGDRRTPPSVRNIVLTVVPHPCRAGLPARPLTPCRLRLTTGGDPLLSRWIRSLSSAPKARAAPRAARCGWGPEGPRGASHDRRYNGPSTVSGPWDAPMRRVATTKGAIGGQASRPKARRSHSLGSSRQGRFPGGLRKAYPFGLPQAASGSGHGLRGPGGGRDEGP